MVPIFQAAAFVFLAVAALEGLRALRMLFERRRSDALEAVAAAGLIACVGLILVVVSR